MLLIAQNIHCSNLPAICGVKAERKVKMYGARNKFSHEMKAPTMMRLRGKKSDASRFIATGTSFSDFAALLPGGAGLQSRRGVRVRESLKHQGNMLRSKCAALTMRSSGPPNTPLRSAFPAH